jgi:hypothetical protein
MVDGEILDAFILSTSEQKNKEIIFDDESDN